MHPRPDATPVPSSRARRGFAAMLLDALHETRRRQAAREIHEHRHLVDDAKAAEMWRAIARSHAKRAELEARTEQRSWLMRLAQRADAWTPTARVFISQ
jgi:transcription elongation GreA/GreB family factor